MRWATGDEVEKAAGVRRYGRRAGAKNTGGQFVLARYPSLEVGSMQDIVAAWEDMEDGESEVLPGGVMEAALAALWVHGPPLRTLQIPAVDSIGSDTTIGSRDITVTSGLLDYILKYS